MSDPMSKCIHCCVFADCLYPCIQLVPSPPLPHYLPQFYEWQRLPRILCGLAGIHYQVPQDIFYAGERRQVKHVIIHVIIYFFWTLICLLYSPIILTVHISQILVEACLLRSLLRPAPTRWLGCVWAVDIALPCNPPLQMDWEQRALSMNALVTHQHMPRYILTIFINTFWYLTYPCKTPLFTVCVGGRLDVVFLVPASTDRISRARPLRELLTSVAGSLNTIGARDSQVLVLKSLNRAWLVLSV